MSMSGAPLMLSVSGMRGFVGSSLTPPVAARYAAAFGQWLGAQCENGHPPRVVIGRDSRPSGEMIECAAVAGLVAVGCQVIRLGIVSTPAVAVMVARHAAQGGMVITASHNPAPWNGIKLLRHDAVAPPPDQVQQIIDNFQGDTVAYTDVDHLLPVRYDDAAVQVHCDLVCKHFDVDEIARGKLTAVIDSVHGAGGGEALALMEALGVHVIPYYNEPTGRFPHPPEPTKTNLTELCDAVKKHGANIGFAQDPDADRLAIVDESGRYIGEEYTFALCARHMLEEGGTVAANLSTSRMIDDIAQTKNAHVIRTPVGEANVAAAMRQHHAKIGGEGNGGVIFAKISQVRDSLVGMAAVLEMLANEKRPLSQIVSDVPAYAIVKDKIDIAPGSSGAMTERVRQAFADQKIDDQDGIRVDWPDRWVHVRPSNTEPILRIIAEAASESQAQALIDQARSIIQSA